MEGKFLLKPGKYSHNWFSIGNVKDKFRTINKFIYFDDMRHFGSIDFLNYDQFTVKWNSIGPDLLTDTITNEEWSNQIKKSSRKNMQICVFLMNQSYFSGIGAYLCADILYESKVSPDRLLNNLNNNEINSILKNAKDIIKKSYKNNGLTSRTFLNLRGERGMYQTIIYGKKCDNLGNPISKIKCKNGRTIQWVPNIQT